MDANGPKSQCWACNSALSSGQKLCTECKSWQNYRRYINFSTTSLSLLIALISVTGVLGPQLIKLVSEDTLASSITNFGQETLSLDVHYSGDSVAVLKDPISCKIAIDIRNTDTNVTTKLKYSISSENLLGKLIRSNEIESIKVRYGGRAIYTADTYSPIAGKDSIYCVTKDHIESNIEGFDLEFVEISFGENICSTKIETSAKTLSYEFSSTEIENYFHNAITEYSNPKRAASCPE